MAIETLRPPVAPPEVEADPLLLFTERVRTGWPVVAQCALLGTLIAVVVALAWPVRYRGSVSFVPEQPQSGRLPGNLGALAGQFGISLGADASNSPRFYGQLVKSDAILRRVIAGRTPTARGADSVPVIASLDAGGRSPADSVNQAIKKLRKRMIVDAEQKSNIVTVSVDLGDPVVAAEVANMLLREVQRFNTENRQTQAGRRRRFLSEQVEVAQQALRESEQRLTGFYRTNRSYSQSPELRAREAQLSRALTLAQEIATTLQRNLESARIDEVNDVPMVSVIDEAAPPTRKVFPKRWLFTVVGTALGAALGVLLALSGVGTLRQLGRLRHGVP